MTVYSEDRSITDEAEDKGRKYVFQTIRSFLYCCKCGFYIHSKKKKKLVKSLAPVKKKIITVRNSFI